jgi:ADP-heptose:LPS heptosyltransferase
MTPFTLSERVAVRRLAIVRALHLGDLLVAVPALRAIRRAFPAAEITLIGLAWSKEFVRRFHRYLDRWREFPGYPGMLEVEVNPDRTRAFLAEERAYRYDLVLQLHGNGSISNQFALALGGRRTVGYYPTTPPDGLTLGAPYPDQIPEIERHLGIVRLLGLPADDRRLEYPVDDADEAALQAVAPPELERRRPLIGLHPGARPSARRWPTENFAEVGDQLSERYGAQLVVTAGPGEGPIAERVIATMRSKPINLAERTSLGGLAALIRRCDLLISNDTGPAHLAVALDRPSITIFGPADRRRWAPLDQARHAIAYHDVDCSPCPHWDCPIDHRCLRGVTPAQVLTLADRLLSPSPGVAR